MMRYFRCRLCGQRPSWRNVGKYCTGRWGYYHLRQMWTDNKVIFSQRCGPVVEAKGTLEQIPLSEKKSREKDAEIDEETEG